MTRLYIIHQLLNIKSIAIFRRVLYLDKISVRVASERVESPKGTLYYRGSSSSLLGAQKIKSSFGGAKRIPSVELNFSPVPDVAKRRCCHTNFQTFNCQIVHIHNNNNMISCQQ